jgi:pimeloyl-ACP methyl ester carboxylesterase
MKFFSNTFNYNGTPVAWYQKGEGKPLIILHGWGSSGEVMKPIADKLSGVRNCVIADLPGFGNSPAPPEAWSIGDYADMVSAFVNDRFPGQPVDMLVHSFGARILLKLLSKPERPVTIDKMIITGGAGLKPKRSLKFHLKKLFVAILKAPIKLLPPSKREAAMDRLRGTSLWKSLGSSDYRKLSGVMRETFVKSVTEFFDETLHDIPDDILLLWGTDDEATPLDQARRLEKGLKNGALVLIDNAGHYAFLDQPAKFTAISKAYLEG